MAALPKNFRTMTQSEYSEWRRRLSDEDHDYFNGRTINTKPEYFVYWAEKDVDEGDTQGPNIFDKKEDALKEYETIKAQEGVIACRVEKVIDSWDILDRDNMSDRNFTDVVDWGNFPCDQEQGE